MNWEPHAVRKGEWEMHVIGGYHLTVTNKKPARDGVGHWRWQVRKWGHNTPILAEGHEHKRERAKAMALLAVLGGVR